MPGRLLPAMDSDAGKLTNGVAHEAAAHALAGPDGVQNAHKPPALTAGGTPAASGPAPAPVAAGPQPPQAPATAATDRRLTNGDHKAEPADMADSALATNGDAAASEPDLGLPEELVHMIANNYWSMSTLIERVAQECFNDLNDLVASLEEPRPAPVANGVSGSAAVQAAGQAAAISVRKKQLILEFANTHRHKFIKLMVLLQWGKRSEEIKKLVNVMAWLRERTADFVQAADAFALLKQELFSFKQPNPDIPTALETLSCATASRISDLGYIPPEPLTNAEIRRTLYDLDALLSIRINLHEDLPRHLRHWDVANGRATFRIPDEFEFDVTIADEDPESQFYFLDIRFLFTPAPELPDGPVRVQLSDRADQTLKVAGLQGCFDLLHDFVLTSQVSVLRKQAFEMSRGAWHDNIRVEMVHRSLVVQYWTEAQSKSWIEVGVSSGQAGRRSEAWRGPPTARLGVRWFRGRAETPLPGVEFDWTALSMERVLKQVLAQHVSSLFSSIEKGVVAQQPPAGLGLQACRLTKSADEPSDCSLTVQVRGQRAPFSLVVEPIGGRMLFSPPSKLSASAEGELNGQAHPESTGAATFVRYAARLLQEHAKAQASHCGWSVAGLRVGNAAQKFKQSFLTVTYFRGPKWGGIPWVIAYIVNIGGGSWYAVELDDAAAGENIACAHPIPLPSKVLQQPPTAASLRRVERRAVDTISIQILSRQLAALKAGHSLQQERVSGSDQIRLTLLVQAQRLLRSADAATRGFADGLLRLHVENYHRGTGLVDYLARGTLPRGSAKLLAASLTAMQDSDVNFSAAGPFVLKMSSDLGASCVSALTSRLLSLSRYKNALNALKRHNLDMKSATLMQISFEYSSPTGSAAPATYEAHVEFSSNANDPQPITTRFSPTANPHRRIQRQLTQLLSNDLTHNPASAWDTWVTALLLCQPVLHALDALEARELRASDPAAAAPPTGLVVHARKYDWFRLDYRAPHLVLDVRLRRSRDKMVWLVEAAKPLRSAHAAPQPSPALMAALRRACATRGTGWRGLSSCVEASMAGVADAVLMLDQVVRDEGAAKDSAGGPSKPAQQKGGDVVDLT